MEQAIRANRQLENNTGVSGNAPNIVTAEVSRRNAKTFYYGNIIAAIMPFPFFIFWFGASMFVYAMYRHHPNSQVGHHTQKAAYYYYALAGIFLPAIAFTSSNFFFHYWWLVWGVCFLALVPASIIEIVKINKEKWTDTEYKT